MAACGEVEFEESALDGAVEEHHAPPELGLLQQLEQVLLGAAGLREDHGFLLELRK